MSLRWWWLSFADPLRPPGRQFLGVLVVPGVSFEHALEGTFLLGLNPGGEVVGNELPPDKVPAEEFRGRLLSRDELVGHGLGDRVVRDIVARQRRGKP